MTAETPVGRNSGTPGPVGVGVGVGWVVVRGFGS